MTFFPHLFGRRSFTLPEFDPVPLAFASGSTAELPEKLIAQAVGEGDPASNVVALATSIPTPGALRESIERHLQARPSGDHRRQPASPAEELRQALVELRRSLG